MTVRVAIKASVRDGRAEDAIDLTTRVNARIVEMGGPPGQVYQELAGENVGCGLRLYWDFDSWRDWGTWEDASTTDERFQKLFAEVLDPNGPFVIPFERRVYRSIP